MGLSSNLLSLVLEVFFLYLQIVPDGANDEATNAFLRASARLMDATFRESIEPAAVSIGQGAVAHGLMNCPPLYNHLAARHDALHEPKIQVLVAHTIRSIDSILKHKLLKLYVNSEDDSLQLDATGNRRRSCSSGGGDNEQLREIANSICMMQSVANFACYTLGPNCTIFIPGAMAFGGELSATNEQQETTILGTSRSRPQTQNRASGSFAHRLAILRCLVHALADQHNISHISSGERATILGSARTNGWLAVTMLLIAGVTIAV